MDQTKRISDLETSIAKLQQDLDGVSAAVYKNNFGSTQTFNKDCIFSSRLKVPHYSSAPSVSEVGDLIEVGGILYICTVANTTFSKVGGQ